MYMPNDMIILEVPSLFAKENMEADKIETLFARMKQGSTDSTSTKSAANSFYSITIIPLQNYNSNVSAHTYSILMHIIY